MARRFRFNLDPVLRYREIMENQKRLDFAKATRLVEAERFHREEIRRERGEMQDEIVKSFQEGSPFQSIVASYHMISRLEQETLESLKRSVRLEIEREKKRQVLIAARKETRVMETLKERRREEFAREQDRLEQGMLDELAIQAGARRKKEEKRDNNEE